MFENDSNFNCELIYGLNQKSIKDSQKNLIILCAMIFAISLIILFFADIIIGIAIAIFSFGLLMYSIFAYPKAVFKQLAEMCKTYAHIGDGVVNHFKFTEDELTITSTDHGKMYAQYISNYKDIYRVVENSKLLYIYINKAQIYILEKDNMTKGDKTEMVKFFKSKLNQKTVIESQTSSNEQTSEKKSDEPSSIQIETKNE